MLKTLFSVATAMVALAVPAPAAAAALGPDAESCRAGAANPAVLVNVTGFKNRVGRLRVQLYGGDPVDFLAKGKKLRRIDLPVTSSGPMRVCVAIPQSGRYAIAVRHDADGNGKSGWNDGGGFSGNPKINLISPKPKYAQVAINVGNAVKPLDVVLNYRRGLSVGPVASN